MLTAAQVQEARAFVRDHLFRTVPATAPRYPFISAEYRWVHTLGVTRYAVEIARAEGADADVCCLAALFHDACFFDAGGYQGHPEAGAALAARYLAERGFAQDLSEQVARAVRDHAGKGAVYWSRSPLEVKVLVEADLLDKVGLNGCATYLLLYGSQGEYQPGALRRLRRELLDRAEASFSILWTPTGTRLARELVGRLRTFLEQWADELPGDVDL